jgi:hypothetical protein
MRAWRKDAKVRKARPAPSVATCHHGKRGLNSVFVMMRDQRGFSQALRGKRASSVHPVTRAIAFALVIGVFWVVTLSASPCLHEWIHPDAGDSHHDCAVTLFASGQATHVGADFIVVVRPEHLNVSDSIPYREKVVGSFFLSCSILEHAPPSSGQGRTTARLVRLS